MDASFMKPSPKSLKRAERPPSSTSATVIKATQPGQNDGADEMDMDVPRSLDVDPAIAHRQRRSEFFSAAQKQGAERRKTQRLEW